MGPDVPGEQEERVTGRILIWTNSMMRFSLRVRILAPKQLHLSKYVEPAPSHLHLNRKFFFAR